MAPRGRGRPRRAPSLEERIYETLGHQDTFQGQLQLTGVAGFVGLFDEYDGQIIALNSAKVAHAYAQLAEDNERFRRLIEYAMTGGTVGAAIIATLGMALPILIHHGIVPGSLIGGPKRTPRESEQPAAPTPTGDGSDA